MRTLLLFTGILLFAQTIYAQNCNLNENARRYVVRGDVAIKEAKNDQDFISAAEEFKKALQYAPDCPDIYESIGACYEKSIGKGKFRDIQSYAEAIWAYKKYLDLKPNLPNKEMVLNTIYELEYKRDKLCERLLPPMRLVQGGYYIGIDYVSEDIIYSLAPEYYDANSRSLNSYSGAIYFLTRLNAITGKNYRLPYERELNEFSRWKDREGQSLSYYSSCIYFCQGCRDHGPNCHGDKLLLVLDR